MKSLIITILFSLITSGLAFDLPSAVKKSIKKHCEGEVVGIERERVKGFIVYAITAKEGKHRTNYFFSESGRLIHHARDRHHDEEEHDDHERERDGDREHKERERDGDREHKERERDGDRDEEDRFDRFEEEKEMSEKERREHDEREGHEEDEEEGPETYEEIDRDELPEEARRFLKKHFGDKKFHVGRELLYIVETKVKGRELVLIFNRKGELVEKEFHEDEDHEDEDHDEKEDED